MNKKLVLGLVLAASTAMGFAADKAEPAKHWTTKGVVGINASQTSFVNWSAGGDNTVSLNGFLDFGAYYKKGNWSWDSDFSTQYGNTYTKSNGWVKSSDKIDFSTKVGHKIAPKWYLSALFDFKTQYDKGYKDPKVKDNYISKFMAPAYSNIALGVDYKPNENFSAFLSPITGRMIIVGDTYLSDKGAFGVKEGKKFKMESGAYVKLFYQRDIMTNVKLISKANFFTSYNKDFGNVVVNWENTISMKVNKYLNANIYTNLQYDDRVKRYDDAGEKIGGARVQFKEMIGVGVAYNF